MNCTDVSSPCSLYYTYAYNTTQHKIYIFLLYYYSSSCTVDHWNALKPIIRITSTCVSLYDTI